MALPEAEEGREGDHNPPGARCSSNQVPLLQRLLVAQDTGGAIRGPVRGDVFWGPGDGAAVLAGRIKPLGRIWLLLPRSVEKAVPVDFE